jgi:hypothetical protein
MSTQLAAAIATATAEERTPLAKANFAGFLLAGKATFTIQNVATEARITFRVVLNKRRKDRVIHMVWANLLGDGDKNWVFLGHIYHGNKFYWSETKSPELQDSPGVKTIAWLVKQQNNMAAFPQYAIYHEGRCCFCGRPLTVPASILSGRGPECARREALVGVAPAEQTRAKNPLRAG